MNQLDSFDQRLVDPEAPSDLSIFDVSNPNSLVNIAPKAIQEMLPKIPNSYLGMWDCELKKKCEPTPVDHRLRITFWDEYNRAQALGKQMQQNRIYAGVCSREYWDRHVVSDYRKVAWLINPPADYMIAMREILHLGVNKLREILDLEIKNSRGQPDARVVAEILKAFHMVDQRVRGSVVQRVAINQKNLNLNVDAGKSEAPQQTLEEIDAELEKLKSQLTPPQKMNQLAAPNQDLVIDARPVENQRTKVSRT